MFLGTVNLGGHVQQQVVTGGEGLHADVAVADFTADGIDDLAVSAPGEDEDGVSNDEGAVYVIYGRNP